MREIWIIVRKGSETYGHGSYGESYRVATTGSYDSGPPHPAFPSEQAAQQYIASLEWPYGLRAIMVELRTETGGSE